MVEFQKPFHVVENHHLVMVADGVGGGDGEDFIQGADAARKGYEDVALGKHQVLAVAEIITRNLNVEVRGRFCRLFLQA